MSLNNGVLSNLRVLQVGEFITAPYCAKLLGGLGAEVIEIEDPSGGDQARKNGPFLNDKPHPEKSGLFLCLNLNKLGLTLNLENSLGRHILWELARQADILIESTPPSKIKERGLDWETISKVNPQLIVTSITPFGHTGPYRDYRGNDFTCWNISSLAHTTPHRVKQPSEMTPLGTGEKLTDLTTGVIAAVATICALFSRQRTGKGQHVDISQFEAIVSLFARQPISYYTYDHNGTYRKWYGSRTGDSFPCGYASCKDGYVALGNREMRHWNAFLEALMGSNWKENEQLKNIWGKNGFDIYSVGDHWEEVVSLFEEWGKNKNKQEIYDISREKRLAIAPCNQTDDLFRSPQLKAKGFFTEIDHPEAGKLTYPGAPFQMSETPWQVIHHAPCLGEHNEEIICNRLGYSKNDLVKLRQLNVI